MKKLLSIIVIAVLGMSTVFAQTVAPAAKKTAKKTAAPAAGLKKDGTPDKRLKANAPIAGLKKDGTPDMRLKANAAVAAKKEAKIATAPVAVKVETAKAKAPAAKKVAVAQKAGLNKDGTPDMRLKANKVAKVATGPGPKKKDGTPDMRYKVNKEAAAKKN